MDLEYDSVFVLGQGKVTGEGIKFQESNYTNPLMIKQKWFEQAAKEGSWDIPVLYQPPNLEEIIIFEFNYIGSVKRVSFERHSEQELQEYYEKLNQIKELIFQRNALK